MSGGLFPGRPFALNLKCIVFTLVVAGGYWFLPPRALWVLVVLLWLPYVAMAWYDYTYDCADKLQPTLFPLGRLVFSPFKPPGYRAELAAMTPAQLRAMDAVDHVAWYTLALVVGVGAFVKLGGRSGLGGLGGGLGG